MSISRGDVWVVDLDPTVGTLPIRLVAPLTEWKDSFSGKIWLVKIEPDAANGLSKASAADTLQLRGVDTSRFQKRLGSLTPDVLDAVAAAVAAVVEFQP